MRLILVASFLIATGTPVAAQWDSIELQRYRTASNDFRLGYVTGYVDGILAATLGPAADSSTFGRCLGEIMSRGAGPALHLRDVFDQYVDDHLAPELEEHALEAFVSAVFEACALPPLD